MLTIGFSSHHVEALPFIRAQMESHQLIVLEEPPAPHFQRMLRGTISIEDYLMELDSGFPEFERQMCQLLRKLHHEGRRIIQVEPYLEKLLQVHELFAAGQTINEVIRKVELKEVYLTEKNATGALISYYRSSVDGPFRAVVEGVKDFARTDAVRLTLRERLRAKAIAKVYRPDQKVFVEAGYIHYPLHLYLRRELGRKEKIRAVFLLAPLIKKLRGKRRNMGPGDILTLHYALQSDLPEERSNLLAARSLVYIKLIKKEELLPGASQTPHLEDEVKVNRLVDRLNLKQCQELFERIRLAKQERAVELAQEYIRKLAVIE